MSIDDDIFAKAEYMASAPYSHGPAWEDSPIEYSFLSVVPGYYFNFPVHGRGIIH